MGNNIDLEKIYTLLSAICETDLTGDRAEYQRGEMKEDVHYYEGRGHYHQTVKTVIPNLLSIQEYDDETFRQIFHCLFEIDDYEKVLADLGVTFTALSHIETFPLLQSLISK